MLQRSGGVGPLRDAAKDRSLAVRVDCVMDELGCGDEDTVVNMDSDGQHPPERIPEMMEARRQGFLLCGTYILSEVSKIAQGGRFVARIFDEVTRRPAYVIEELPT